MLLVLKWNYVTIIIGVWYEGLYKQLQGKWIYDSWELCKWKISRSGSNLVLFMFILRGFVQNCIIPNVLARKLSFMTLVFPLKRKGFFFTLALIILIQNIPANSVGLYGLECFIPGLETKPNHLFWGDFCLHITAYSNTSTPVQNPSTHNSHNYTGITCLRSKIVWGIQGLVQQNQETQIGCSDYFCVWAG